jgi:hypothetical protein
MIELGKQISAVPIIYSKKAFFSYDTDNCMKTCFVFTDSPSSTYTQCLQLTH